MLRGLAVGLVLSLGASASDAATPNAEPFFVEIGTNGVLVVDGEPVSAQTIQERVGRKGRGFLRGSGDLTYNQFKAAMDQLSAVNLSIAIVGSDAPE